MAYKPYLHDADNLQYKYLNNQDIAYKNAYMSAYNGEYNYPYYYLYNENNNDVYNDTYNDISKYAPYKYFYNGYHYPSEYPVEYSSDYPIEYSVDHIPSTSNTLLNKHTHLTDLQHKKTVMQTGSKGVVAKPVAIDSDTINIDYNSIWFQTEKKLPLEIYLKILFQIARLKLSANVELDSIKAAIVPHAGIKSSGLCAASTYYSLRHRTTYIKRIILFCTNHTTQEIVGTTCKHIKSYKGNKKNNLAIDTKTMKQLEPYITINNEQFQNENGFVSQIPFIESIAPQCMVIPLLIGNILGTKENNTKISKVFKILCNLLKNDNTVLVCTSDLSHVNGEFESKINNNIYYNIRSKDSEALKFIYDELDGHKSRTKKIDDILFIQNSTVCGIFAMYLFAKLLNMFLSKMKNTKSNSKLKPQKSDINTDDRLSNKSKGKPKSKKGKSVSDNMSNGSRFSTNFNRSSSLHTSSLSTGESDHNDKKTTDKKTTDKNKSMKLYPHTVCYYTSIQRSRINLFDYDNSQLVKPLDIKDNSVKSVSYAGIIFTFQPYIKTKQHRKLDTLLSEFEKCALLSFAKERLYLHLNTNIKIQPGSMLPIYSPVFKLNLGVFTTIYNGNDVRGCIGTTETDNDENTILSNVSKYIIESATHDSRFYNNPITLGEFNNLSFSITILYKIKPITINEYFGRKFSLGYDGLFIKQGSTTAYFLPSVAKDFKYNKQELLEELCVNKLGSDKRNCYLQNNTELFFNEGYEIKG